MSAEGQTGDPFEFDLDEDLFNFDEASTEASYEVDDEDLDAIFAAFDEEEEEAQPELATALEEDFEDDLDFGLPGDADDEWIPDDRPAPLPDYARVGGEETALAGVAASREARPGTRPRHLPRGKRSRLPSASTALILFAVTSVNALVAVVALKTTGDMKNSVLEGVQEVSRTAEELRRSVSEVPEPEPDWIPTVPPDAENHPTFERVQEDIEKGEYASARRRLYSLLSIVDRLDPEKRARVEARANYFIAQAWHLEAVQKFEVEE